MKTIFSVTLFAIGTLIRAIIICICFVAIFALAPLRLLSQDLALNIGKVFLFGICKMTCDWLGDLFSLVDGEISEKDQANIDELWHTYYSYFE